MKIGFGKKNKKEDVQQPRSLDEIQKEYGQVLGQVANAQYLVFVHQTEQAKLNNRLLQLNQEAAVRKQMDADTKKEEPK